MQSKSRLRKGLLSMAFTCVGFAACTNPTRPPQDVWPATAGSAADTLRKNGYACVEEGRELYPILYACTKPGGSHSSGIFLYADDRNDLVGIRVFAREDRMAMFQEALRLAYAGPLPPNLFPPADEEWRLELSDDLVVEAGGPVLNRHLRITPKSRIVPHQ